MAIIEQLDMPAMIALCQTSRLFARLADPRDDSRKMLFEAFLIDAQSFARWQNGESACFSCKKILEASSFASNQLRGTRGQNGTRQRKRFCIPCGLEKKLYAPGNQVIQDDLIRFRCRQCKRLRGGSFCHCCAICESCERESGYQPLARCEWGPGHTIIGRDPFSNTATKRPVEPPFWLRVLRGTSRTSKSARERYRGSKS